MKFKVYGAEEVIPEPEKEVYLRLIERGGLTQLIACDSTGERLPYGNLMDFNRDGTIHLCGAINENLGFQLTEDGEIVEN